MSRLLLLNRRLILAALVLLLAVGGAYLRWPSPPTSAINRENAAQVRVGMTVAAVEQLLGGAARDESTGPVWLDWPPPSDFANFDQTHGAADVPMRWQSDEVILLAWFGPDRRAATVRAVRVQRPSWLRQKVAGWLPW